MFAGGCFWGVEHLMKQLPGVVATRVGYSGGEKLSPVYEEVCAGGTGHFEVVEVEFDPKKINYEDLLKFFFEIHDFEQANGQGPDIGEQYLSRIFYFDEDQKKVAERIIEELNDKGFEVQTKLLPAGKFWEAEQYHQDYYSKTGKTPYCHLRRKIF